MHVISPLMTHDFPAAFAIEKASHAFSWRKSTFNSNQGERYLNLKLTLDDTLVAFAITQVVLDEATLFNIAVHPTYQRQGHGRRLLKKLIEKLEARGIITLWLEVRASNAIALYEQLGFNEVSLRRNYYPAVNGREDAVIMALPL
ncbi:MAG: ribosomal protein S18-alanine N-acetyltransferase [Candidatus Malihini olakiniferum]